jgi:predicted outer membrane lipoprotein
LYACFKEIFHLWTQPCFDTFLKLITVEMQWSKAVLPVGKQVVVIIYVKRVVKQLPPEMLQQLSNVSSCMWMCIVMEEHYVGCQHFTPFVLNGPVQFSLVFFAIHFSCYRCLLFHEFHYQHMSHKTPAFSFLADSICVNFLLACLVNVCAFTAFTALWFQHSQMKHRFHHLLLVWCDWEIRGIALKKVKAEAIFWILCEPTNTFRTDLAENLWW